jgi:peptide/nickel transport system permease protein
MQHNISRRLAELELSAYHPKKQRVGGDGMGRQIIHRLLISLPALLGVLFLCFCLLQVVPADPAIIIAGPDAKKETVEAIRKDLGLDQPIVLQFVNYIGRVAQGDLGRSIISNKKVIEELAHTIGPTVELMVAAMLLAVPVGLLLGTLAAVSRGSILDRIIMAISVAGVSMPVFFIGLLLIQVVGYRWGLLPFTGRAGPVWAGGLPSLILPAVTLGSVLIGPIARITRTAVLEVLGADFVRTARAKGLKERVVIMHHALRNALIPVVTLIGLQAAFLLGGAVVTETMFSWPGVGRLAVGAITSSDFPTAQGAIMVLAISFLAINLIVDVIYVYLDPRVQRE